MSAISSLSFSMALISSSLALNAFCACKKHQGQLSGALKELKCDKRQGVEIVSENC